MRGVAGWVEGGCASGGIVIPQVFVVVDFLPCFP